MTKLARANGMKEYQLTIDDKKPDGTTTRQFHAFLAMNEDDAWEQIHNTVDAPQGDVEMTLRRIS